MREQIAVVAAHVRRLGGWWAAGAMALLVVGMVANQQLGVLVYKVLQVQIAVVLAYMADRSLFRHAPVSVTANMPQDAFGGARLLARAIVALAVIAGVTIGI